MKVLGIDMGYANLAWCIIDTDHDQHRPTHWKVERILTAKKGNATMDECFDAIVGWVNSHFKLFVGCDAVVLERQMKKRYIVMNTVVRTIFRGKTYMAAPTTVQKFFGLPRGRDLKKKAAIELCEEYLDGLPTVKQKQDDMADAALLALYHLFKCGELSGRVPRWKP